MKLPKKAIISFINERSWVLPQRMLEVNGVLIDPGETAPVDPTSIEPFDWGRVSAGSQLSAYMIIKRLYTPVIAMKTSHLLYREFVTQIPPDETQSYQYDLHWLNNGIMHTYRFFRVKIKLAVRYEGCQYTKMIELLTDYLPVHKKGYIQEQLKRSVTQYIKSCVHPVFDDEDLVTLIDYATVKELQDVVW